MPEALAGGARALHPPQIDDPHEGESAQERQHAADEGRLGDPGGRQHWQGQREAEVPPHSRPRGEARRRERECDLKTASEEIANEGVQADGGLAGC